MNKRNKIIIIVSIITLILFLVVGVTYGYFQYLKTGGNQGLILTDIYR